MVHEEIGIDEILEKLEGHKKQINLLTNALESVMKTNGGKGYTYFYPETLIEEIRKISEEKQ